MGDDERDVAWPFQRWTTVRWSKPASRSSQGNPRQQQHLDQREVRGEEPRQSREARHELGGVVDIGDVAAPVPEPDDGRRIAEQESERDGGATRLRLTRLSVP